MDRFTISKMAFIDKMVIQWCLNHQEETRILLKFFRKNCHKGEILKFNKFSALIRAIEPKINDDEILKLFKEALRTEMDEE